MNKNDLVKYTKNHKFVEGICISTKSGINAIAFMQPLRPISPIPEPLISKANVKEKR